MKQKKEFKPEVCGERPPRTKTSKGQLSNCVIAYRCRRTSTKEQAIFSSSENLLVVEGAGQGKDKLLQRICRGHSSRRKRGVPRLRGLAEKVLKVVTQVGKSGHRVGDGSQSGTVFVSVCDCFASSE